MIFRLFQQHVARRCQKALWLLTTVLLLLPSFTPAEAAGAGAGQSMDFILVHGDMARCRANNNCPDWISAEGQIMADSPKKLQRLLKRLGGRKLPIIVSSPGGDVRAAMEMAYVIRKQKLAIAVGRTRSRDCSYAEPICSAARAKDGSIRGETFSLGAICFSACPLFFAGGTERVSSPFALLGVHQITTTYSEVRVQYRTEYELVNGKRKVLSTREVGRKFVGKHDTTKLDRKQTARLVGFLNEMGVDKSLVGLMLGTRPSSIHLIAQMDALKLRLTTELAAADQLVAARDCKSNQSIAECAAPPAASSAPAAVGE
ncbi:hypothetical protein QA648_10405 [Rhizobium sp. CB3171]|uniref:COG3904 family protein n=1 Tax=Rhizobium sp. CB3171 TaxID=3039157 RepID=UPI0024B0DDB9|nr:hypothetical protein [Rhizobium sp. CB3171]WFU00586.1 hypothetical protein QA648_10405 [Rhizobium sp. CB3171]